MTQRSEISPADPQLLVDARGDGEWIVSAPAPDGALHVYRLGPADWLVSEVGHDSEGRGCDLGQALDALSAGAATPAWWQAVPALIDGCDRSG